MFVQADLAAASTMRVVSAHLPLSSLNHNPRDPHATTIRRSCCSPLALRRGELRWKNLGMRSGIVQLKMCPHFP